MLQGQGIKSPAASPAVLRPLVPSCYSQYMQQQQQAQQAQQQAQQQVQQAPGGSHHGSHHGGGLLSAALANSAHMTSGAKGGGGVVGGFGPTNMVPGRLSLAADLLQEQQQQQQRQQQQPQQQLCQMPGDAGHGSRAGMPITTPLPTPPPDIELLGQGFAHSAPGDPFLLSAALVSGLGGDSKGRRMWAGRGVAGVWRMWVGRS